MHLFFLLILNTNHEYTTINSVNNINQTYMVLAIIGGHEITPVPRNWRERLFLIGCHI
jgi:hypothetical protein